MSWRASAHVKQLSVSDTGKQIERGEKLVLMILADYHHDEKGYAEVGLVRLGQEALYERRQLIRNIQSLEEKHFMVVERERVGQRNEINKYYIIGIATPPVQQDKMSPENPPPGDIPGDFPQGGDQREPGDISVLKMSPKQDKPNENTNENNKKTLLSAKADESAAVKWLFEYYLQKFRRDPTRYTLTDKRKQKALMRLRERLKIHKGVLKLAVADMKHAIEALLRSQFHVEGKFIEWDKHLFQSEEKLQMWLNRAAGGGGPGGKEPLSASERMMEGLK